MTIPWAGSVPYGEQANAINQFMTNQAVQPFIANLPGYANMVGKRSENTQSMLQGNLPQDVQNQIAQRAAERGVGGGQVGSPNSNSALLQALGLNSFQMQQTGSEQLSKSIADTPIPELWNPAGLFEKTLLGQQEQQAAQTGQASMNRPKLYASKGSGGGAGGLPTGSFDYSFYM
jgi:hypothetical protein